MAVESGNSVTLVQYIARGDGNGDTKMENYTFVQ